MVFWLLVFFYYSSFIPEELKNFVAQYIFSLGGDIFLNLLKLLVVPLVFFSLVSGISSLSDTSTLGPISLKTIGLYLETANYDKVDGSYNYLLNMPIYSLTKERFDELLKQEDDKKTEKKVIEGTDPKDMYLSDLEALKKALK